MELMNEDYQYLINDFPTEVDKLTETIDEYRTLLINASFGENNDDADKKNNEIHLEWQKLDEKIKQMRDEVFHKLCSGSNG